MYTTYIYMVVHIYVHYSKKFQKVTRSLNTLSMLLQGAFTPVTMDGNIVVDGVLASCYAFPDHHLAHFGMTPIRLFPGRIKWLLGDDKYSPVFVEIMNHMGEVILPFSLN